MDYYSKWPEDAFSSLLRLLRLSYIMCLHPLFAVMDNGPQFLSSVFSDFHSERGIKYLCTSVYHPQGNGAVERWNRVLKEGI